MNHWTNNLLISIIRAGRLIFFHLKDKSLAIWFWAFPSDSLEFSSLCLYYPLVLVCYLLFFLFAIRDLSILIIVDLSSLIISTSLPYLILHTSYTKHSFSQQMSIDHLLLGGRVRKELISIHKNNSQLLPLVLCTSPISCLQVFAVNSF